VSGIDKPNDLALTHTKGQRIEGEKGERVDWSAAAGFSTQLISSHLFAPKYTTFAIVISVKVSGDAFAR